MTIDAPSPLDHPQRLAELERFRRAAKGSNSYLPDIIAAARYAFRANIAALTWVGPEDTTFGRLAGYAETRIPTRHAFCRRVAETGRPLIIKNAIAEPEHAGNPYVVDPPYTRFYAGVPIRVPSGHVLGAFAVLSEEPCYRFTEEDLEALRRFAAIALSMTNMQADLRAAA